MFKRLMIGLLALSLAAIWLSEANAARAIRKRRSVETTITCGPEEVCISYVDLITPVDETCEFTGTLICAPAPSENGDVVEAMQQLEITIEECKKGKRKGHIKGKGKGHDKGKGKGHTLTCLTEPEAEVPAPEEGGLPAQGSFVDDEAVFESEIPNGDAVCEEYFPGEDLVFVTFWINEFYGITKIELGEAETEYIYQHCVLPEDPELEIYDCADIENPCDVIPQCGEEPIPGCGPEPSPDCEGETCASFTPCNQPQPTPIRETYDSEGGCQNPVCGSSVEGEGVGYCVEGNTPCAVLVTGCVTNDDCDLGEFCAEASCCEGNVCVPTSMYCPPAAEGGSILLAPVLKSAAPEGGPTFGGF